MGGQRRSQAVERKRFDTAIDMARALPHLFKPIATSPALIGEEAEALAQCEAAVTTLQWAFWLAGKALQIIRDGRLYRATHATFEDYCLDRWGMRDAYANKLIRTWRIAESLFESQSNGSTPIGVMQRINQAQVWELVGVAETWDTQAAATVYRTVATSDIEVTAAVLKGVVATLPRGDFSEENVTAAILTYLDEHQNDDTRNDHREPDYAARAQKAVPLGWLRRVVQKDRAGAEAYLDQVQQQIDKARAELLA